jgi:hypothetical protein
MMMWLLGQAQHYAPFIQKMCFLLGASLILIAVLRAALVLRLLSITEFAGSLTAFLPDSQNVLKLFIVLLVVLTMGIKCIPEIRKDSQAIFTFLVCALNAVGFAFLLVPAYLAASGFSILILVGRIRTNQDKEAKLFAVLEAVFILLALCELAVLLS